MIVTLTDKHFAISGHELPYDVSHHIASLWLTDLKRKIQPRVRPPFSYTRCILSHIDYIQLAGFQRSKINNKIFPGYVDLDPTNMIHDGLSLQETTCIFPTLHPSKRLRLPCNYYHPMWT